MTLLELCTAFDFVPETLNRGLRKRGWQRPLNAFSRELCELTEHQRGYANGFEAGKLAAENGPEKGADC